MKNKMEIKCNVHVAGVYTMSTKLGKVLYVGSSVEIGNALSRHLYNLKRGKYTETNKKALQLAYDREDLVFEVIHESAHNSDVNSMTVAQKEDLQKALGVLEEMYIDLYKSTICNVQRKVTKSSSAGDENTLERRRAANIGSNNPNAQHDEELVANILYFKELGLKPREIVELLLEHDIEVDNRYISRLGITRWITLKAKSPEWYSENIG